MALSACCGIMGDEPAPGWVQHPKERVRASDLMEAWYLMAATCTAKSKTTGKQCKNPPVNGATVCRIHGGAAPQVQAAAARRVLDALVTPALIELRKLVEEESTPKPVKLGAIKDILDRTGYKAPTQFEGTLTMDMVEREIARLEAELEP